MLLNNQWITEEIKEKIKKYLDSNDNKDTTIQNLWEAAKAILRGKFLAIQAHLRKISNKLTAPKANRERRTKKTQGWWKKRNHKDQRENKWNRNEENNRKDKTKS